MVKFGNSSHLSPERERKYLRNINGREGCGKIELGFDSWTPVRDEL